MQILPDGQVQITNSETGEVRTVHPMQLSSINPFLANQYYTYMTQQKALDKASAGSGATDVLTPPADNSVITGGNGNQQAPDLSGLSQFASPIQQPLKFPLPGSGTMQNNTDSPSATLAAPKPKSKPAIPSYPKFSPNLSPSKLKLTL